MSCKQQKLVSSKSNFVHFFLLLAIISSPKQYASLLSSIKTCLQHIENIIETHSPATYNPISRQTTGDQKRPPLPPKPSRMQKPVVPPKPKVPSPTVTTTSPSKPPATATIETELPGKLVHDTNQKGRY